MSYCLDKWFCMQGEKCWNKLCIFLVLTIPMISRTSRDFDSQLKPCNGNSKVSNHIKIISWTHPLLRGECRLIFVAPTHDWPGFLTYSDARDFLHVWCTGFLTRLIHGISYTSDARQHDLQYITFMIYTIRFWTIRRAGVSNSVIRIT